MLFHRPRCARCSSPPEKQQRTHNLLTKDIEMVWSVNARLFPAPYEVWPSAGSNRTLRSRTGVPKTLERDRRDVMTYLFKILLSVSWRGNTSVAAGAADGRDLGWPQPIRKRAFKAGPRIA